MGSSQGKSVIFYFFDSVQITPESLNFVVFFGIHVFSTEKAVCCIRFFEMSKIKKTRFSVRMTPIIELKILIQNLSKIKSNQGKMMFF